MPDLEPALPPTPYREEPRSLKMLAKKETLRLPA